MAYKGFNLIRPQLSPPTAWDKIYAWMVGTARVIVIIVELAVVVAFVGRITVDAIGKNLDKEIVKKDAELTFYEQREQDFKDIQEKTGIYRAVWEVSSDMTTSLKYINNIIRNYGGSVSVSAADGKITISGTLTTEQVRTIEDKLDGNTLGEDGQDKILFRKTEISIDSRSIDSNDLTNFTINIDLATKDVSRDLSQLNPVF